MNSKELNYYTFEITNNNESPRSKYLYMISVFGISHVIGFYLDSLHLFISLLFVNAYLHLRTSEQVFRTG